MILNIFGYVINFTVYKVSRKTGRFPKSFASPRCLIAHDGHFFLLVDPDGKVIPGQTDLAIYSPLNEPTYAVVTMQVNGIHKMDTLIE